MISIRCSFCEGSWLRDLKCAYAYTMNRLGPGGGWPSFMMDIFAWYFCWYSTHKIKQHHSSLNSNFTNCCFSLLFSDWGSNPQHSASCPIRVFKILKKTNRETLRSSSVSDIKRKEKVLLANAMNLIKKHTHDYKSIQIMRIKYGTSHRVKDFYEKMTYLLLLMEQCQHVVGKLVIAP